MNIGENFKQAILSLSTNKLRSILTMIGIIMGVFSVVAIMAISNAAKVFLTNELNKMGANTIMVSYASSELTASDMYTLEDLDILKEGIPDIEYAAAVQTSYFDIVEDDEDNRSTYFTGVTPEYNQFQTIDFDEGRFITSEDLAGQRKVVVVSDTYAEERFGTTEVLGETIQVVNDYGDYIKLRIVGVTDSEGGLFANLVGDMEMPVELYVPMTTAIAFSGSELLDSLTISVRSDGDMERTGSMIVKLLSFVHNNKDKYSVMTVAEIQEQVGSVLNGISMIFLVIAIITLVVGGIGIVNILLVSVTERIREIGLRKAIGARKKDIVLQFLAESVMMTGISGLIGIILGLIVGGVISSVIKIPPIVDVKTVVLAFLGSIILGIVFGVYPAKKAADLDPIESLRFE